MTATKTRYIALLRGINIGGHSLKMERLRELFGELGFENVRTYIQTGNVFFDSESTDQAALEATISQHLQKSLGYAVPTFVRTVEELDQTLKPDPFEGITMTPDIRLCVLLTSGPLPAELQLPLEVKQGGVMLIITKATPGAVLMAMYQRAGRPGNPVQYIEKTFNVRATARFYHTTLKILAAAQE